jgi:hypothetical protein
MIIFKILIKNVIKQPGPVGAADRPQETQYELDSYFQKLENNSYYQKF